MMGSRSPVDVPSTSSSSSSPSSGLSLLAIASAAPRAAFLDPDATVAPRAQSGDPKAKRRNFAPKRAQQPKHAGTAAPADGRGVLVSVAGAGVGAATAKTPSGADQETKRGEKKKSGDNRKAEFVARKESSKLMVEAGLVRRTERVRRTVGESAKLQEEGRARVLRAWQENEERFKEERRRQRYEKWRAQFPDAPLSDYTGRASDDDDDDDEKSHKSPSGGGGGGHVDPSADTGGLGGAGAAADAAAGGEKGDSQSEEARQTARTKPTLGCIASGSRARGSGGPNHTTRWAEAAKRTPGVCVFRGCRRPPSTAAEMAAHLQTFPGHCRMHILRRVHGRLRSRQTYYAKRLRGDPSYAPRYAAATQARLAHERRYPLRSYSRSCSKSTSRARRTADSTTTAHIIIPATAVAAEQSGATQVETPERPARRRLRRVAESSDSEEEAEARKDAGAASGPHKSPGGGGGGGGGDGSGATSVTRRAPRCASYKERSGSSESDSRTSGNDDTDSDSSCASSDSEQERKGEKTKSTAVVGSPVPVPAATTTSSGKDTSASKPESAPRSSGSHLPLWSLACLGLSVCARACVCVCVCVMILSVCVYVCIQRESARGTSGFRPRRGVRNRPTITAKPLPFRPSRRPTTPSNLLPPTFRYHHHHHHRH